MNTWESPLSSHSPSPRYIVTSTNDSSRTPMTRKLGMNLIGFRKAHGLLRAIGRRLRVSTTGNRGDCRRSNTLYVGRFLIVRLQSNGSCDVYLSLLTSKQGAFLRKLLASGTLDSFHPAMLEHSLFLSTTNTQRTAATGTPKMIMQTRTVALGISMNRTF